MAFIADQYKIRSRENDGPKNWKIFGSQNGVAWTEIDVVTNEPNWATTEERTFTIDSPACYRYYKMVVTCNWGATYTSIYEWRLLYLGDAQNADMTANDAPAPNVVTGSAAYSTDYLWKGFDYDDATRTRSSEKGSELGDNDYWLQLDTGADTPIPAIVSLTPDHGAIGATVVIAGTDFGASQGASTVKFNGTTATCSAWSDTEITCTVPVGATTGDVVVDRALYGASAGSAFTVHPYISDLDPASGEPTDHFDINGANFGAAQGGSTVTLDGDACGVVNWSDVQIEATVPAGATDGNVVVTVGGNASNGKAFDVLPNTPTISGISPDTGVVGDTITVTGTNFGALQGSSTVKFGAVTASVSSWGATEIDCVVPLINNDCSVTVVTPAGTSNGEAFTLEPELISMSPDSGRVGDEITLSGTGFKIATGAVYFGTEEAGIETWSNTTIVCTVPAITNDCNVKVTSNA